MPMERLIGQKAVIRIRDNSAARHGPFRDITPPYVDIEGVIMKRPHWDKDSNNFSIAVAFSEVPLRIVNIRQVLSVNGVLMQNHKSLERTWKIRSSKGDAVYTVKEFDGNWTCECRANADFRKICRHIKEARGE